METVNSLLPTELILRDVLQRCDDEALRHGITKGGYINFISNALTKMAMNTYYAEEPALDVNMPKDFRWKLPDNFFNISELYAFNGDCCNVAHSQIINYKRNFNNSPNGKGYTALNKGDHHEHSHFELEGFGEHGLLYANIQNGILMFSSSCIGFEKFRIVYMSFGGAIGEKPMIPRPLREVVTDYACLYAFEILMNRYPKSAYGGMYQRTQQKIENKLTGSRWEAEIFVKSSDTWVQKMRESYGSYPMPNGHY